MANEPLLPVTVPTLLVGEEGDAPSIPGAIRLVTYDEGTELWTWASWFVDDDFAPTGLAVDAAGDVYCSEYWDDRILKIHTAGASFSDNGRAFDVVCYCPDGTPAGVALDVTEEYLYVAMWDSNFVARVTLADGTFESWWGRAPGGFVWNGFSYVLDNEGDGPGYAMGSTNYLSSGDAGGGGAGLTWDGFDWDLPGYIPADGNCTVASSTTMPRTGSTSTAMTYSSSDPDFGMFMKTDRYPIPVGASTVRYGFWARHDSVLGDQFVRMEFHFFDGGGSGLGYNDIQGTATTSGWLALARSHLAIPAGAVEYEMRIETGSGYFPAQWNTGEHMFIDDVYVNFDDELIDKFSQPQGVARGSDGEFYLTDRNVNTIKRLNADRTVDVFAGSTEAEQSESVDPRHRDGAPGTAKTVENFAICAGGDELFFCTLAQSVRSIDLATADMGHVLYSASLDDGPDTYIEPDIAEPGSTVYSPVSRVTTSTFFAPLDWPNGITCTPDGATIFVADYFGNNVFAIDRDGQVEGLCNEDDWNYEASVDGVEYRARTLFPTQAIAYVGEAPYAIRVGPGVGPGGEVQRGVAVAGNSTTRVRRRETRRVR